MDKTRLLMLLVLLLTACTGARTQPAPRTTPTTLETPMRSRTPSILLVAATRADSPTPIPTLQISTSTSPASLSLDLCRNQDVTAQYADSDVKNDSVTISINLTNHGAIACNVQFFPKVQLLDLSGKPLDYDHHFFKDDASMATYLLIEPDQTVGFLIVWKNWCKPPQAGGIKIQLTLPQSVRGIEAEAAGTPLEKPSIYTDTKCVEEGKASEVWVSQIVYNVPVPLHP